MSDTTTANIQESVKKSPDKKKKPSSWSIILKHFRELELPLPSAPETWLEFSALGELLYEPKVIVVTTKILNTALKQKDDNSRHRARVFLTSYVMLMCPNEILSLENEDEKVFFYIKKRGGGGERGYISHQDTQTISPHVYRNYTTPPNGCFHYSKPGLVLTVILEQLQQDLDLLKLGMNT